MQYDICALQEINPEQKPTAHLKSELASKGERVLQLEAQLEVCVINTLMHRFHHMTSACVSHAPSHHLVFASRAFFAVNATVWLV